MLNYNGILLNWEACNYDENANENDELYLP